MKNETPQMMGDEDLVVGEPEPEFAELSDAIQGQDAANEKAKPEEPVVPVEEDETAAAPGDEPEPSAGKAKIFDDEQYKDPKLKITPVDGREVDRIAFAVSGTITLDRKNPEHVSRINAAKLGHDAEFKISCVVTGRADKAKVNEDGYVEQVTRTIGLQATDVVFDVAED